MTPAAHWLAAGTAACLMVASCAGDDTSESVSEASLPSLSEQSAELFDHTVVHTVEMEISQQDLDRLELLTDDRVPADLNVDGATVRRVGVRLKQGVSQFQGMDDKPGFSIETDEFVDGQILFDVERFTLGNALWDHSFVDEHWVYELYGAAGIPAARTALARVTLNGETLGLYVMRETFDERWLEQYFEDPSGTLYEHEGGPLDTVLEMRTNKRRDDTSDLDAVIGVVAAASDEEYRDAIEELVDVDELLTYWAIEAMAAHWDGYVYDITAPGRVPPPARPAGNSWPNNFYIYHDPQTDKFVFIPHGADLALGLGPGPNTTVDPSTPVLLAPKARSTIATRLWEDPMFRDELEDRMRWVLDEVWDVPGLTERADVFAELVRADGLVGTRESVSMAEFEEALAARKDFLLQRGPAVRAELANAAAEDLVSEGS